MTEIISNIGEENPQHASVVARVVQPEGERLLQVDIYEPTGRANAGRRSYRIHLTKEAVLQMMRLIESPEG